MLDLVDQLQHGRRVSHNIATHGVRSPDSAPNFRSELESKFSIRSGVSGGWWYSRWEVWRGVIIYEKGVLKYVFMFAETLRRDCNTLVVKSPQHPQADGPNHPPREALNVNHTVTSARHHCLARKGGAAFSTMKPQPYPIPSMTLCKKSTARVTYAPASASPWWSSWSSWCPSLPLTACASETRAPPDAGESARVRVQHVLRTYHIRKVHIKVFPTTVELPKEA